MKPKNTYKVLLFIALGIWACTTTAQSSNNQKINLDKPGTERFALTEPIWPSEIGQGHVCLWKNDKYAAASITIDDNFENEHEWWLGLQEKHKFTATWFVILRNISNWDNYQTLIDAGNEVQAHDHCDINDFDASVYATEVKHTQSQIDLNLTNNKCTTFAYPCGDATNEEVVRESYISTRGVVGLMNNANTINYLNLNSRSATNDPHDLDILLNQKEQLWGTSYHRGWFCTHYHSIAAIKSKTEDFVSYLSSKSDSIWIGNYSDVAKYGQERDTHTLTMDEISDSLIKFTLVDEMHDEYFDQPLTVKIRINNKWKSIKLQTPDAFANVMIIENKGNKYALVNVRPDQGPISLIGNSNTPPSLDGIEDQTGIEGTQLEIEIKATDADHDDLQLETRNLPTFGSFMDQGNGSGFINFEFEESTAGTYKNIEVLAYDYKDTVTTSFTLVVESSTDNKELSMQPSFSIYPNPIKQKQASKIQMHNISKEPLSFELFNTAGIRVFQCAFQPEKENNHIELPNHFSTGVYFAKLYNQHFQETTKVLITE